MWDSRPSLSQSRTAEGGCPTGGDLVFRRPWMSPVPQAFWPKQATCKCCGAAALLYGVVDFHKNCEIYRRRVLDVSGVPIYYYRCPACQFVFTTAFDHFTTDEFLKYIYNEEYLVVDPDYIESRPRGSAANICGLF